MTREDLLRSHFTRDMRLIEIGPSYNPVIPKAGGWQTSTVDHASQAELVSKYGSMGVTTIDRIEPVDYVWQSGSLSNLFPEDQRGQYDGLLASHVGEHFPDLIGFLNAASELLKESATLALALPDKRVCFDFFQPLTTSGDLIAAHKEGRTRHRPQTFFNQSAYLVTRDETVGWSHQNRSSPFHLANPLKQAQFAFDQADESPSREYQDTHAWTFTPKSFELLILELNLLGHIDWSIREIKPADGIEFYVWLEKKRVLMDDSAVNPLRLSILKDIVRETGDAIAQIDGAPLIAAPKVPVERPFTVSVVIPLYNGARFIEEALRSVFSQTFQPKEVFVVDDGSTDGGEGAEIVERLSQANNVTLITKQNGGQSSARNLGFRHSSGDLIAFLDQDDVWYDQHLEKLRKPFLEVSAPPIGWVYSDLDEIDEDGHLVCRSYLSQVPGSHPKTHIFDCIRQDMFILPSATMFSRQAFEASGGYDEQLCGYEDDDICLRLFRLGYQNIFIETALSQWRIYPGSTSYSYRMALSRNIYTRKLLSTFPDDVVRARYYVRDLIVPRFFNHAIADYRAALLKKDAVASSAAWAEVLFLAKQTNAGILELFYKLALQGYKAALGTSDPDKISAAWTECFELAKAIPGKRHAKAVLGLLEDPKISKIAFGLRRIARPAMLLAFR